MRDSTHSGGRWRNCCNAWEAVAGPLGAPRPSGSGAIEFNEIAADLESLDIVSATPAGSIRFSPDRRLPYFPSSDPGCCMGRKMRRSPGDLFTVCSWLRGKRTPLERRAVLARRYWGRRLLLERRATQRYTNARTLLGTGAGSSRTRLPGKPMRAVTSQIRCASPPVDPAEVRAKLVSVLDSLSSARSLEGTVRSRIGNGVNRSGACRGSHRRRIRSGRAPAVREGGPYPRATHSAGTRHECPGIITMTNEKRTLRKDWMALLRESLELAGTSASPLRGLPNLTKHHCDGQPQREQRRIENMSSEPDSRT